jgi:hypothetical protein
MYQARRATTMTAAAIATTATVEAATITRCVFYPAAGSRKPRASTTARALAEISGQWDAVYEAMRRKDTSQEPER